MQCPKCAYEPTLSEMQSSPDKCPRCQIFYIKFGKKSEPDHYKVVKASSSNKLLKLAVIALFLAALFGGWKFYDHQQKASAIEEQVRLTSAYVTQVVTALDDSGSMTFAEFFEKSSRAVAEIDNAMVRVSVVSPESATAMAATSYMKKAQELIRAMSGSVRAMMKYSSSADRVKEAEENQHSANKYIRERAIESKLDALKEQLEILESMKGSRENMVKVLGDLREAGEAIPSISDSALIAPQLYEKLSKLKQE